MKRLCAWQGDVPGLPGSRGARHLDESGGLLFGRLFSSGYPRKMTEVPWVSLSKRATGVPSKGDTPIRLQVGASFIRRGVQLQGLLVAAFGKIAIHVFQLDTRNKPPTLSRVHPPRKVM